MDPTFRRLLIVAASLCFATGARAALLQAPATDGPSVAIGSVEGGRVGGVSLAPLSNGAAVVAWDVSNPGGAGMRGGVLDAVDATLNGFDLAIPSPAQKYDVDVVEADGGFLAVWTARDAPGAQPKIMAQRFGLNGASLGMVPGTAARQIDQGPAPYVFSPAVSAFGPPNAQRTIITWSAFDPGKASAPLILGQRLFKDGRRYEAELSVAATGAFPDATRLRNTRSVVVWTGAAGVAGRLIGAPGDEGAPFTVAATGDDASVAAIADGGFVVLWKDFLCSDCLPAGTGAVLGRRFDASGVALGPAFKMSQNYPAQKPEPPQDGLAPTEDDKPRAAALTNGGFLAVWEAESAGGAVIAGRLFGADGAIKGGEIVLSDVAPDARHERPDLAALGGGRLALGWASGPKSGANELRLRIVSEAKLDAMAADAACVAPPQGMVFRASFDADMKDVVAGGAPSYSTNATLDPSVPQGRSGRSLKFAAGGGLVYPAGAGGKTPFRFSTGDFSVEAWVKLAQPNAPILSTFASAPTGPFGSGPPAPGVALSAVNGQLAFTMSDGQRATQWTAPPQVADNRWRHIAIIVDRDAPNGGTIFIDGAPAFSFDPRPHQAPIESSAPLIVGNDPANNQGAAFAIDELAIYHRALTASEIGALKAKSMCK